MMDYKDQLKLQAYLDGELTGPEMQEVAKWLDRDQSAADLALELRNTRKSVMDFHDELKLPESREFYWSKIEREIQRQEVGKPVSATPWYAVLRRVLVPASAVAFVVFVGVMLVQQQEPARLGTETALADSGAMIFRDYSAGATFVWLSYPAEDDVADLDDPLSLD
jgi:anti-sigma factor RsiW